MITTKFFLFTIVESFVNKLPTRGISPKTGTFWIVDSFLFSINPPIITLSPLFKIAVVLISFFKVSGFPLAVWVVLIPSNNVLISRVTFD